MLTAHVLSVLRRHLSHYDAAKKMTIAIVILDRLNVVLTLYQVLHNNNAVSIGDFFLLLVKLKSIKLPI